MIDKIREAQRIVGLSTSNKVDTTAYHNTSFIYRKTNEEISSYYSHLENKNKILSVIASSNQILNSILAGTKNIDAYDISVFPEEYLYLNLAAIEELDKEDYIEFFYGNITTDEKYDDMYFEIRKSLPEKNRKFWDGLFDFYDWYEMQDSPLFSNDIIIKSAVIRQNKYLQDDNYELLREKIKDVNIKPIVGNVLDLSRELKDPYDLVNLSSIAYYNDIKEYIKAVKKFNLTENGEVLTYLYEIKDSVKNNFKDLNASFEKFPESDAGVMIYQKIKR